jgi:predicted HTH domain antitoxin
MNAEDVIIGLLIDGKLLFSSAARALNMTPVEFVKLLGSRGIVMLRPAADEIQRELEGAACRTRIMPAKNDN